MNNKEFNTFINIKVQALVDTIMFEKSLSFFEALNLLYNSETYKVLLQENTKIWHFSTPKLFEILINEHEYKILSFPDYA